MREWHRVFIDWGPLAEDSATKLKRSQLNVCTVYGVLFYPLWLNFEPEPVLLKVYGAPELMPRNEFRQPM